MTWIISILIVIYIITSAISAVVCSENKLLDFYWNEYNIFERIMLIILLINSGIIFISLFCIFVWGTHTILMEII